MIKKNKNDISIIGDAMIKRVLLFTSLFVFAICSLVLTSEIKENKNENADKSEELDIAFTKVVLNNEDVTDTLVQEDNKTFMFVINNLSKVGDNIKLLYTINNKSNKDLNIEVTCTNTKQYSDYYTFTNTYENKILKNQELEGNIEITLNKETEEEIKEMFMCNLTYTV